MIKLVQLISNNWNQNYHHWTFRQAALLCDGCRITQMKSVQGLAPYQNSDTIQIYLAPGYTEIAYAACLEPLVRCRQYDKIQNVSTRARRKNPNSLKVYSGNNSIIFIIKLQSGKIFLRYMARRRICTKLKRTLQTCVLSTAMRIVLILAGTEKCVRHVKAFSEPFAVLVQVPETFYKLLTIPTLSNLGW